MIFILFFVDIFSMFLNIEEIRKYHHWWVAKHKITQEAAKSKTYVAAIFAEIV